VRFDVQLRANKQVVEEIAAELGSKPEYNDVCDVWQIPVSTTQSEAMKVLAKHGVLD
jgi:hypothetical protein